MLALTIGWISSGFSAQAQDSTGFTAGQAIVVATDGLNLRDDATNSANVLTVLPQATYGVVSDGPIEADDYSWYLINVDGLNGYVAGEYLADAATAGAFAIDDVVTVNTEVLNLRSDASISADTLAELTFGETATVLDGPVDADGYSWYQLDLAGTTGWAARDYLAYGANTDDGTDDTSDDKTEVALGETLYVNTDVLNVRDLASTTGSVLETAVFGDALTSTGSYESADGFTWAEVQTAAGTTGFVVSSYLTANSEELLLTVGAIASVTTDALNLRDSAGLTGSSIGTLVTGDLVTILSASEAADGYLWYQVESTSGTGWVVGTYLSV